MQLYFCSVCGVSIPQTEIDTGTASAGEGRFLCSEHRQSANDAKNDSADAEVELLFCANCHVSIPQDDVKSGRAPREFGSLLCRHCSPLDPPGRAGRRHAVENALADEEADDLIGAPAGAAGPAPVSLAHAPAAPDRRGGGGGLVAALILVALGFGIGGWALGEYVVKPQDDTRLADLESRLDERLDRFERSIEDVTDKVGTTELSVEELSRSQERALSGLREGSETMVRTIVDDALRGLRGDLAALRGELTGSDAAVEKRLDRVEERMEDLSARFTTAIAAAATRRDGASGPTVREDTPEDPGPTDPDPTPPVDPVDPQVAKLARELLDSDDESARFTAATELGRLGDPTAISALSRAVADDAHYLVRRASARSLGSLKAWNAVPVLIDALEEKEAYVAQQAGYALEEITGQDFGVTQELSVSQRRSKAKAARRWWQQNGATPPEGVSLQPLDSTP